MTAFADKRGFGRIPTTMSAAASEAMKKLEMVWRAFVRYMAIRTTAFPTIVKTPEIQLNTASQINAGDLAEMTGGLVVSFIINLCRGLAV